jgi:hypothetical protein
MTPRPTTIAIRTSPMRPALTTGRRAARLTTDAITHATTTITSSAITEDLLRKCLGEDASGAAESYRSAPAR